MTNSMLTWCAAVLVACSSISIARPSNPVLNPDSNFVDTFCSKIESYQQGSNHYFICLETGRRLSAMGVTGQQLVDEVCGELADLFYDEGSVSRCYLDGNALLGE